MRGNTRSTGFARPACRPPAIDYLVRMLRGRGIRVVGAAIAALLAFALLASAATAARDSDRDGLPDRWEQKPKRGKKPAGPLKNLRKLGARPDHRDVFVEVDYANGFDRSNVSCGDLDGLVDAFAGAPLTNPDGKGGIRLHIDAGFKCPSRSYSFGGSSRFQASTPCANPNDIGNTLAVDRLKVFHIAGVVGPGALCGAEGIATSTDFMLNGQFGFGHVFMHELGHVFGLDHGNINSFSVMSQGLLKVPTQEPILDFNRYPISALNEASLSEADGYQSTPAGEAYIARFYGTHYCGGLSAQGPANADIDWDCDGAPFWMPPQSQYIDPGTVSHDIDGNGVIGTIPAAPAEWPLVQLGNGRIGG